MQTFTNRIRTLGSALAVLLAAGCGTGTVVTGTGECSPAAPDGACPAGEICVAGTCEVDCSGLCGGGCPPCGIGSGCGDNSDCDSGLCTGTVCRGDHCDNGIQDGDETGSDCGGSCGACGATGCTDGSECASGVCTAMQCAGATCSDGVKNGLETDVDCGGGCIGMGLLCSDGGACGGSADCTSGLCSAGTCQTPPPHCQNTMMDADETGVDCGGADCLPCPNMSGCTTGNDCQSGICGAGNVCATPPCTCQAPSCTDGVLNGDETGADCGGSCTSMANGNRTCNPGTMCSVPGDCSSGVCNVTCQAPSCMPADGVQNGTETDVDCGGMGCPACGNNADCNLAGDCQSGVCGAGNMCPMPPCACQAPTCADGVQNDLETGVDCGGATCVGMGLTCPDNDPCGGPTDCQSGVCNGTCQPPSCVPADGVQNGTETGVDCGGPGCPGCGMTGGCNTGMDCADGVCGPMNVCAMAPCTCQAPTCADTVQNMGETGVDCGGPCLPGNLCPAGTPCSNGMTECLSGFCHPMTMTCQATSCLPPDGIQNGGPGPERESDIDCGGTVCPACATGRTCMLNSDCQSGFCNMMNGTCEAVACGDGAKAANEDCDDNSTMTPTDDDLGGMLCSDFGFGGGTLACNSMCKFDLSGCTGGCGNHAIEGTEQCDGTDLGGASCQSLGYDNTPGLLCDNNCSLDPGNCTNSTMMCPMCPPGGFCNASTNFLCDCPIYQTACAAGCTSLLTDPMNCGSCGNACTGGEACSNGVCSTTCPFPLVMCGSRCIDPQIDQANCGASDDCLAGNAGTACMMSESCLSGSCAPITADYTAAGDAPTRCVGGGPVIDINDPTDCTMMPTPPNCVPDPISCTGSLAAVTFRYAICSCSNIRNIQELMVDGFNSSIAPYSPECEDGTPCTIPGSGSDPVCTTDGNGDGHFTCADETGAGIGANGSFNPNQLTTVWGTMWLSSGDPMTYPDQVMPVTTVEQDLKIGNTMSGGGVQVRGDAEVVGDITATGLVSGTLFQSTGSTSTMTAGTIDLSANPLVVPEACDCDPTKLIPVDEIVTAHACAGMNCTGSNNDNDAISLNPTLLSNTNDIRLDLPCGQYYFNEITAGSNVTVSIVVHGRTAIYVGGNIDIPKTLNITLTDSAELDVFVFGGVCVNDTLFVGNPSYPARVRFYAAGGGIDDGPGGSLPDGGSMTSCAPNNDEDRAFDLKSIVGAANMYAPFGSIYMPQTFTLYGSIFAGRAEVVQDSTFHFDTGIVNANLTCNSCGDGVVDPGEDCDGGALAGATCSSLGYTGGPLLCTPSCTFDTSGCCGDGVRGGVEDCDDPDLGGITSCADLGQMGTLSCSSGCTYQGCTASACSHDGVVDTGNGEECDQGNPTTDPDLFPAGMATCAQVLGIGNAMGTLSCNADCTVDTSACTYCGDGLRNGTEDCDGADFDLAPGEQITPPPCSEGSGLVTCSAFCALDTDGCSGCIDCRDCNNQACNGGVCGACTVDGDCCAPLQCDTAAGFCKL